MNDVDKRIPELDELTTQPSILDMLAIWDASSDETMKISPRLLKGSVIYDVKDYGAVGDGVTNDTAAIQETADRVAAAGGGTVWISPGTFSSNPIYFAQGVSVDGVGEIVRRAATVSNTDSIGVLNFHGTAPALLKRFFVKNIRVNGNKANIVVGGGGDIYDVEGISLKFCQDFLIENVTSSNVTADGIDIDDSVNGLIIASTVRDNGGSGVHVSENCVGVKVAFNTATGNGIALSRSGFDQYSTATNSVFIGNTATGNYRGFNIDGSGAVFIGNKHYGNTNANITTGVSGGAAAWVPVVTGFPGLVLDFATYTVDNVWFDADICWTVGASVPNAEFTIESPVALWALYQTPHPVGQAIFGDTSVGSYPGTVMIDNVALGRFRVRAHNTAGTYEVTTSLNAGNVPFAGWNAGDKVMIHIRARVQ